MEENSQEQKKNIIIHFWKLSNFKNQNSMLLETIEDSKWTVPSHHLSLFCGTACMGCWNSYNLTNKSLNEPEILFMDRGYPIEPKVDNGAITQFYSSDHNYSISFVV